MSTSDEKLRLVLEAEDRLSPAIKEAQGQMAAMMAATTAAAAAFTAMAGASAEARKEAESLKTARLEELAMMAQAAAHEHELLAKAAKHAAEGLDDAGQGAALADRKYEFLQRHARDTAAALKVQDRAAEEAARSVKELGKMSTQRFDMAGFLDVEDKLTAVGSAGQHSGKKITDGMEGAEKSTLSFRSALTYATVALAAIGGAVYTVNRLTGALSDSARGVVELDRSAKALGVTLGEFQSLEVWSRESGASIEQLQDGLKTLNQRLAESAEGNKSAQAHFERAGIAYVDSTGQLRKPMAVLAELADRMATTSNASARLLMAQGLLGEGSAKRLVPALLQSSAAFREAEERVRTYGATLTQVSAERARAIVKEQENLALATKGVWDQTTDVVGPQLASSYNTTARSVRELTDVVEKNSTMLQVAALLATSMWNNTSTSAARGAAVISEWINGQAGASVELEKEVRELYAAQGELNGRYREYGVLLDRAAGLAKNVYIGTAAEKEAGAWKQVRDEMRGYVNDLQTAAKRQQELKSVFSVPAEDYGPAFRDANARLKEFQAERLRIMDRYEKEALLRGGSEGGALSRQMDQELAALERSYRGIEDSLSAMGTTAAMTTGEVRRLATAGLTLEDLRAIVVQTGGDMEAFNRTVEESGVFFSNAQGPMEAFYSAIRERFEELKPQMAEMSRQAQQSMKEIEEAARKVNEVRIRQREELLAKVAEYERRQKEQTLEGLRELEAMERQAAQRMADAHQITFAEFVRAIAAISAEYKEKQVQLVEDKQRLLDDDAKRDQERREREYEAERRRMGDFFFEMKEMHLETMQVVSAVSKSTFDSVGNNISSNLSDVVEGTDDMTKAWHDMSEAIIKDLERMIIRAAVFAAIGAGVGTIVPGLGTVAGAQFGLAAATGVSTSPSAVGGAKAGNRRAFADGGVVYGPTEALVGEAGPEAFIPLRNGRVPVEVSREFERPRRSVVQENHTYSPHINVTVAEGGKVTQEDLRRITDAVHGAMLNDPSRRRQMAAAVDHEFRSSPRFGRR